MYKVMIVGAGKIGSVIASMLSGSGDYFIYVVDRDFTGIDIQRLLKTQLKITTISIDVQDETAIISYLVQNQIVAVISSLPYFLNQHLATAAKIATVHYFDLTED